MAKRDVTVWMDEHVYCVLSECLPEGTSIEQELARMLERLYEQTVSAEERRKVEDTVRREEREADAEMWSRRRFVLIKVVKDGRACHLLTQDYRTPLETVHACESCQPGAEGMDCEELAKTAFRNSFPLTREKFEEWCRMRGREVLAVYEIDLDENRMKASVMGHASEQSLDVLVEAAKEAYRDPGLRLEERACVFGEKVREFSHAVEEGCGQEVPSAQLAQRM